MQVQTVTKPLGKWGPLRMYPKEKTRKKREGEIEKCEKKLILSLANICIKYAVSFLIVELI